jgi:hypothetical protein
MREPELKKYHEVVGRTAVEIEQHNRPVGRDEAVTSWIV